MMLQIQHIVAYICMFHIIFQYFETLAAKVSMNQNITGLFGSNDTNLTCSFFHEKGEKIVSVQIIAKNITEDSDDKNPIAIFEHKKAPKLPHSGAYLSGRVTLTNITKISTSATLTFHRLEYTDEKNYMCKIFYYDMFGDITERESKATRISVKVQVRDVHIKNEPNQKQYDEKTDNITLTCKASGNPEPTYIWLKEDNSSSILSRTNLYIIEDVIRNNSGVYICHAYNVINNIKYRHSSSVNIDIVDELLSPSESVSSKISAVHAAYAVPIIIAVGLIVIFLAVRKHRLKQSQIEKNKESRWQNMVDYFISCGFTKKPDYTLVVRNNNPVTVESGDASNGLKENKISCRNKEVGPVKTVDISQNMPTTSSNIYADPKDTLPAGILKDRGKYEDHGASPQTSDFAEGVDQEKIIYHMSKTRTSEPNDYMNHNEYAVPEDQCHA